MRMRLMLLFLLAGFMGFAQNSDQLDPAKVRKLKLLKTSPQEAVAMFGAPAKKEAKDEIQKFTFQSDNAALYMEFNKNNDLMTYHFMRNYPGALVKLDYEKVKAIVPGKTTPDEILKQFGERSQIEITTREEKWFFSKGSSQLAVTFSLEHPDKVSEYLYSESSDKSTNVPDDKLEMLTKRVINTQDELLAQFGVPKIKRITADKEEWEYRSGFMKIQVRFDKATGKIKNYLYQPMSKIPAQTPPKDH